MALETIVGNPASQKGRYVYTSKMNDGEAVSGYLVGFKEGKFGQIIVLQAKTGEQLDVLTSGSLRYLQKDAADRLITGAFTVITKTASYKTKTGKNTAKFSVAQDKEDTTTTAPVVQTEPTGTASGSVEERLANLKKRA